MNIKKAAATAAIVFGIIAGLPFMSHEASQYTLSIEGEAFREDGQAVAASRDGAYRIIIRVGNVSREGVPIDAIEILILPEEGGPFQAGRKNPAGQDILRAGRSFQRSFTTGKDTADLLRRAGGKPLLLAVNLQSEGEPIMDQIYARLPDIADLPPSGGRRAGFPLEFTVAPE